MPSNPTIDPLPPGVNSLAVITPSLQALMVGHTFLVLLIPLLAALFYYSTPNGRRQPIFILNVLAITFAFIGGVAGDALNIHLMLSPLDEWPAHLQIALGVIGNLQVMLVDTILLVRLITVHPLSRIGIVRFALLISPPVVLKVTRVVNIIVYIVQLGEMANGLHGLQMINSAWLTLPNMKIEWIAQVVDNSYASIAFIWTIRNFRADTTSESLMSAATLTSAAERIHTLTKFALSNFIIPTLLSIIQLVLVFRIGAREPSILADIALVNARVSVFGVVFATVWAGKEHRREANIFQNASPMEREQQCPHGPPVNTWRERSRPSVSLVNADDYQDDNASVTYRKDLVGNQDNDLVQGPSISLRQLHTTENGSAIQDL